MILDTSAVLAILFDESDADLYREAVANDEARLMSTANFVEAGIRLVQGRQSPIPYRQLDVLAKAIDLSLEPVTADQAHLAIEAYRDFGKGSGHPAQLNFGDCFAYALAKASGHPLLFKGDGFVQTDVQGVLER